MRADNRLFTQFKDKCKCSGCYEPVDCCHGYCANHCNRNHNVRSYGSRRRPTTSEPHVGLEVEVVFDNHDTRKRSIPLGAHDDGSIASNNGVEFKLLAPEKWIVGRAKRLLNDLWSRRAKAHRSCGIHVHLDARAIGVDRLTKYFRWAKATETCWFDLIPPTRRQSLYLKRLSECSSDVPRGSHGSNSHYYWTHLTEFKTIELRLHPSTLNPYKIEGWLLALIHLAKKIRDPNYEFPPVDATSPTLAFWEVFSDAPPLALEYLKARMSSGGVVRDMAYASVEA